MATMAVVAQDAFAHIQTFVNSLALLQGGSPSFWVDARERFDTESAWARDEAAWPEWLSLELQDEYAQALETASVILKDAGWSQLDPEWAQSAHDSLTNLARIAGGLVALQEGNTGRLRERGHRGP